MLHAAMNDRSQPIPIKLTRPDIKKQIQAALENTYLYLRDGPTR
jgi:hypothetical protein